MAKPINSFSIIVPTHTGIDNVARCLESITQQQDIPQGVRFEAVVVIDGPNKKLRQRVESVSPNFSSAGIPLVLNEHEQNMGRFEARRSGALRARYNQLLFVDDRVELTPSFLSGVLKAHEDFLMPNVLEDRQPNILSRVTYLVRRRVYGSKRWGRDFEPYYIDTENFESSPKGTTALWVPKAAFLQACTVVSNDAGENTKHISDDTKLLRAIVISGNKFYRPSSVKIYYQPRQRFMSEAHHVHQRGPKFVDYYFKPGSRFQMHLWSALTALLMFTLGCVLWHWAFFFTVLGAGFLGLFALAIVLMEQPSDLLVVVVGLPLALVLFGSGIMRGFFFRLVALQTRAKGKDS